MLVPDRVRVPVPVLVKLPAVRLPEKVVLVLSLPIVSALLPAFTVPVPASEPRLRTLATPLPSSVEPVATVSAQQLAEGWNITTAYDGPLGDRSQQILNLISKLESPLNQAWRAASKANDTAKLEQVQKEIEATEAQIQTAVQPVALKFEISK